MAAHLWKTLKLLPLNRANNFNKREKPWKLETSRSRAN